MTEFEERPYGGKTFRPRPETHLDAESGLLIVATPWGPRSVARKTIERVVDYLLAAKQDKEATTPFGRVADLSPAANALRNAVMHANDSILRDENKERYAAGVELFACSFAEREFVWAQVGAPQPFLARRGRERLLPLGPLLDLSFDLSADARKSMPALPSQLLGLDSTPNLFIGGFRARAGDRIVLMSCSSPPDALYEGQAKSTSLETLSKTLSEADPDRAFWIGILKLDERKLSAEA